MPSEYKRCSSCNVEKPLDAFHSSRFHTLGRYPHCKTCRSAKTRTPEGRAKIREVGERRNAKAREIMHELKARPCEDCGGSFPHYVMEFDHPDRSIKTGTISQMLGGGVTPRVLAEIAKCSLICSNCHRIRTRRQFEAGEWPAGRPRFDTPPESA